MKIRDIDQSADFDKRGVADESDVGKRAGISLVRYAAWLFDRCGESLNQLFTAEELLRIASACERSGWDFLPDEWTMRQLEEAARDGTVPQWSAHPEGRGHFAVYPVRAKKTGSKKPVDREVYIYEAQAREDARAKKEGREPRLIKTVADADSVPS